VLIHVHPEQGRWRPPTVLRAASWLGWVVRRAASRLEGALGLLGSGWTGQMELQVAESVGISRQADVPDEIIGSAAQIRAQMSMVLL